MRDSSALKLHDGAAGEELRKYWLMVDSFVDKGYR